ncbi:unnamed protein product, partial [Meganyctiphanes norvegica]
MFEGRSNKVEERDRHGIKFEGQRLLGNCQHCEMCRAVNASDTRVLEAMAYFPSANASQCTCIENLRRLNYVSESEKKKTQVGLARSSIFPVYCVANAFKLPIHDELLGQWGSDLGPVSHTSSSYRLRLNYQIFSTHKKGINIIHATFIVVLCITYFSLFQNFTVITLNCRLTGRYKDVCNGSRDRIFMIIHPRISSRLRVKTNGVLQNFKWLFEHFQKKNQHLLRICQSLVCQNIEKSFTFPSRDHIQGNQKESEKMLIGASFYSTFCIKITFIYFSSSQNLKVSNTDHVNNKIMAFNLLPGINDQIVSLKGVNTTGNKVVVKELVQGRVLPLPHTPISIDNKGPIQMVITCGPFTTNENLLYEPLCDLLTAVQKNPPHILVLLGPLLDAAHPLLMSTDLTETHDSVINRCVKIITSSLENCGTQVVIASSSRDIGAVPVYPTPPYSDIRGITCVSDPALLDIDGIVVALSSTDIIFHLGKEEISYPPQGSDRLGRLTQHILTQQSLYPLYPPPEGMCVDYEQAEFHSQLPCTPHLMILPSELRYFIRQLTICI